MIYDWAKQRSDDILVQEILTTKGSDVEILYISHSWYKLIKPLFMQTRGHIETEALR